MRRQPLIEKDPVLFWKVLALGLLVANLVQLALRH